MKERMMATEKSDQELADNLVRICFNVDPAGIRTHLPLITYDRQYYILISGNRWSNVLRYLVYGWAKRLPSCERKWNRFTFEHLVNMIGQWRNIIQLGSEPWCRVNECDLLTIASYNQNECDMNNMSIPMIRDGGLDLYLIGKRDWYSSGVQDRIRLLAVSSRRLLTIEEFLGKYYPNTDLDERTLLLLLNTVRKRFAIAFPSGLLLPQDDLHDFEEMESIVSEFENRIAGSGYQIDMNYEWPSFSQGDDLLLGYQSLHYLITCIDRELIRIGDQYGENTLSL